MFVVAAPGRAGSPPPPRSPITNWFSPAALFCCRRLSSVPPLPPPLFHLTRYALAGTPNQQAWAACRSRQGPGGQGPRKWGGSGARAEGAQGEGARAFFFLVRGGARLGLGRPGPAHPPHPTMQGWVAVRPLGEGWGRNRLPLSPSRSPALWWPSRMRLGRRCRPTSKNNNNSLPPHPSHAAAMVRTVLITALLAAASTGAFGQG